MIGAVSYFIYTRNANEKCYFNNHISHMVIGKTNLNSYELDTPNIILWGTCILQDDFLRFFFIVNFAVAKQCLLLLGCYGPKFYIHLHSPRQTVA